MTFHPYFRLFFLLPGLLFFLFNATATPVCAAEYVSVKKDGIRIRSAPNTEAEILWEVFKDFPLRILKSEGKWIQTVDFEGDNGWIYRPLTSKKRTVIIKVKTANMRVGPGTAYEVMATVKYGVVFHVIEREGDWFKVTHEDGTTGWVFKDLIWPDDS
ncbi:SH3 domain-containing protein [Thermodesulfobacteriota bacterium]